MQSTTRADAVHRDDDGNVELASRHERDLVVETLAGGTAHVAEVADVEAGAEALARAGDHDASHAAVVTGLGPERGELTAHRPVEGVPLRRPVERDRQHVIRTVDEQRGRRRTHEVENPMTTRLCASGA